MALIVCFTGYIHWLEHMKCMFTQEQCLADDPVAMAKAFAMAVDAGRTAYLSGAMQAQQSAQASTPLVGTPFWHQS